MLAAAWGIQPDQTWAVWTVLLGAAAFGFLAEQSRWGRKLSGCLLTMGCTFVLSNVGAIPADGVPAYNYNFLGLEQTSIAASKPLAPGKATLKFDFAYDGGGPGKGGIGTLYVNGEKVAEGRIEHTQGGIFSADETADVGIDLGTPVVEAVGAEAGSKFNGHIPRLSVEVRAARPNAQAAVKQAQ